MARYDGEIFSSTAICSNCAPKNLKERYPDATGLWERDGDVVKCTNCGFERPYITRNYNKDEDGMTQAQQEKVEWLREAILHHDAMGSDKDRYEYKRFQVTVLPFGDYVEVLSEVGLKGDAGTYASLFARTHRQIWIGAKGGMELKNPARFKKTKKDGTKKVPQKTRVFGDKVAWHPAF